MKTHLIQLIQFALQNQATDLHFLYQNDQLSVKLRGMHGMEEIHSAMIDHKLFHYLKYIANLDLGKNDEPQSGSFTLKIHHKDYYFRFSVLASLHLQTGVLRILNNHTHLTLKDMVLSQKQYAAFCRFTKLKSGLILLSGPTGSGKTTTLHAILDAIAQDGKRKIMTLEDPIEIVNERLIQLHVSEHGTLTYEEGIRQLMRHDPDVIMIGEIRDPYTAKMAYRCALTGHLVLSSIHAKSTLETIKRMEELGVTRQDLKDTLFAACTQRLFTRKDKERERICIYEILEGTQLQNALAEKNIHMAASLQKCVWQAVEDGIIEEEQAMYA